MNRRRCDQVSSPGYVDQGRAVRFKGEITALRAEMRGEWRALRGEMGGLRS